MLDQLRFEEFEAIVGQGVRLSRDAAASELEVAEARLLANPSPRAQAPFVVTLRENGAKLAFAQGMYTLHHPTLGPVELFVVPVGPDGKGMCYEITFN
jgi:hypothetical protein